MEQLTDNELAVVTSIMVYQLAVAKKALDDHNKRFMRYRKRSNAWWDSLSDTVKHNVYQSIIDQYGTHDNCIMEENKPKVAALQAVIDQLTPILNKLTNQQ